MCNHTHARRTLTRGDSLDISALEGVLPVTSDIHEPLLGPGSGVGGGGPVVGAVAGALPVAGKRITGPPSTPGSVAGA